MGILGEQWASRSVLMDFIEDALTISAGIICSRDMTIHFFKIFTKSGHNFLGRLKTHALFLQQQGE